MAWPPTRALNQRPRGGRPGSDLPQHTNTRTWAFAVGAKDGSRKYRAARFTSTRRPRRTAWSAIAAASGIASGLTMSI